MFSNRRDFLRLTSCGFPYLAAASMATAQAMAAKGEYKNPLAPKAPHFEPKVKRVIFLFMSGAPSQNETFDYNEDLEKSGGKTGERSQALLPSIFKFERRGQSGLPISELFPHLSAHADDLCLVNGMQTNSPAHPQASIFLHTGSITFVRPSIGAWAVYGLGTENQALPGFVTLNPAPNGGAQLYGSAFLPATFQGTRIAVERGQAPIDNIRNAKLSAEAQRRQIDLVQEMNREMLERSKVDSELDGLIESFELAFRMQTSVPDVIDIKREPEAVREMYGLNGRNTRDFGTQCLIARRMAEAGVRFIELHHPGWDQHNQLKARLTQNAAEIDKPIAALLTDLKQRSLLKDTLLVWGGEFGRSTWQQGGSGDGRQHNSRGYTMWLAGGGVKGGIRYGRCDANGVAVENAVHLHDLHATILHLMGLDHKRLTFRYAGRDFRLADVHGEVVKGILV